MFAMLIRCDAVANLGALVKVSDAAARNQNDSRQRDSLDDQT